ncbi:MAG: outer membrane protein assembly factor BamC [Rhodoferax sp.]|nr:outer membrane protein assembly factor BamC [Rhodoferax sp.]
MNSFSRLALLGLTFAVTACSMLETDKIDYKSATKAPSLAVPPDLTQLSRDNRYAMPGGTVTASAYQSGQGVQSVPVAAAAMSDVRIERLGNQRWLVVKRAPEQLWDPIRDFWQENGFLLTLDQSNLGIMETDWAENRAKLPQDFIRNSIGKILDSLYSTSERDKFRTRLERSPSGDTEIYISHRGMVEVYTATTATPGGRDGSTSWQPRPANPELEAEFLRRLMIRLGVAQEQAKAVIAAGPSMSVSKVSSINGQPVVLIAEDFDRAWRRVGLSLDRTGFTVEDRDRSQGTYFVRYVEPNLDKSEPGFLSKLFGGSAKATAPVKYRVVVRSQGDSTVVSVLNATGAPDASANAQRIVNVIVEDLK